MQSARKQVIRPRAHNPTRRVNQISSLAQQKMSWTKVQDVFLGAGAGFEPTTSGLWALRALSRFSLFKSEKPRYNALFMPLLKSTSAKAHKQKTSFWGTIVVWIVVLTIFNMFASITTSLIKYTFANATFFNTFHPFAKKHILISLKMCFQILH